MTPKQVPPVLMDELFSRTPVQMCENRNFEMLLFIFYVTW